MSLKSQKTNYAMVRGINLDRDSIVLSGLLKHSGLSMLLDGVLDFMPVTADGAILTACRKVSADNHVFSGHFPDKPICPGHYLLQMSYQAALLFHFCLTGKTIGVPDSIHAKEFINRNPVVPGDTLRVTCFNQESSHSSFCCAVEIKNQDDKVVATIDGLSFSLKEFDPSAIHLPAASLPADHAFFQVGNVDLCSGAIIENNIIPHRSHALLIEGITSFEKDSAGATITALSDLSQHDICFSGSKYCQGHYLLEMCYLTAAVYYHLLTGETKAAPAPFRTEDIAFLRPALNGELLKISCYDPDARKRTFCCSASVTDSSGQLIATIGRISAFSLK
jgi:3-hydroxyacyl-[acyl-carrier-protein] dehydratase